MKVINPLDYEELIKQTKKHYGFDLRKDLKNNNLNEDDFFMFIQDLHLAVNASPKKCKVISANAPYAVYKTRHKDDNRNIGTSSAYRLLSMSDGSKVFPFHLYHKTSGKQHKLDLTETEKKMVKKMIKDAI